MIERIIAAGFGGQGIMTIGHILATSAMNEGKHVTFFPVYGAEVRGGTAYCQVIVSDEAIYSPVVEQADLLIILNQPSYDKFRGRLRPGGALVLNVSMSERNEAGEKAGEARFVPVRATEIANELGNVRATNIVMLGAYSTVGSLPPRALLGDIDQELADLMPHLLELNRRAFQKGREAAPAAD